MEKHCLICERINLIRRQANRYFVAEFEHSFVVLADSQRYTGYCIVALKKHQEHLHALSRAEQCGLTLEVTAVANAIWKGFGPLRLNYECLGNSDPHIHWHIIPRYDWDPDPSRPIWVRPPEERNLQVEDDRLADLKRIVIGGLR